MIKVSVGQAEGSMPGAMNVHEVSLAQLRTHAEIPWTPTLFRDGIGDLDHLDLITGLVLDQTAGTTVGPVEIQNLFPRAHLTWCVGTEAGPRWSVLVPLARGISARQYVKIANTGIAPWGFRFRDLQDLMRPRAVGKAVAWNVHNAPTVDLSSLLALAAEPTSMPGVNGGTIFSLEQMCDAALTQAERRVQKIERPIPLPWPSLARVTGGGLWPGLFILAGATGSYKTWLAVQMAYFAALNNIPTIYVSLELGASEIGTRILALAAGSSWSKILRGEDAKAVERARNVYSNLPNLPFHGVVADPYSWPAKELQKVAENVGAHYRPLLYDLGGLPTRPMLIFLDYLQVVGPDSGGSQHEQLRERIQKAAYTARKVARDQNAVVFLLSSASRDHYKKLATGRFQKKGKGDNQSTTEIHPSEMLATGKESGEIEYGADVVEVLVRAPANDKRAVLVPGRTLVDVAFAKVRAGEPAWATLEFDGIKFHDHAPFAAIPAPAPMVDAPIFNLTQPGPIATAPLANLAVPASNPVGASTLIYNPEKDFS
jgi:hypothetical protein